MGDFYVPLFQEKKVWKKGISSCHCIGEYVIIQYSKELRDTYEFENQHPGYKIDLSIEG